MKYVAFETADKEIFVCTERAALNMAYQGFTPEEGKLEVAFELVGQVCELQLMTCPLITRVLELFL